MLKRVESMRECRPHRPAAAARRRTVISSTVSHGATDLKRGYEAQFLERAGRLPLGQASKREVAVTAVTGT